MVDLDSTICEVHGKQKRAAGYGYTKVLGYHPLLATRATTGEVLLARMRHGSANTARGVDRFVDELVGVLNRAGAAGSRFVRADSGFWSWKMIDRLDAHRVGWSITVRLVTKVKTAIASIDDAAWVDIDYTLGGRAPGRRNDLCHRERQKATHGSVDRPADPSHREISGPAVA